MQKRNYDQIFKDIDALPQHEKESLLRKVLFSFEHCKRVGMEYEPDMFFRDVEDVAQKGKVTQVG